MMKNQASRLKNRIEVYKKNKVQGKIGDTYEEILVKKLWAEIKFQSGSIVNGEGDTEANNTRFKFRVRKTEIDTTHIIKFKELVYEIDYIYPDFKNNSFIEIFVKLKTE
ncbi:MAG: head-tail adaptor protein [Sarcina sp.]